MPSRMHAILLLALVLLFLGLVSAESDIITLNADNFESLTQASTGSTTGSWLIKFYAPWCGHCKNMQPAYEEVATALKGEINVAEVDVSAHRALGSRFDIKGFPTLIYLNGGKLYKYEGRRVKDAMISFARETYKDQAVYTPSEVRLKHTIAHVDFDRRRVKLLTFDC
jgi:thioredoxin domain-containing protein 5